MYIRNCKYSNTIQFINVNVNAYEKFQLHCTCQKDVIKFLSNLFKLSFKSVSSATLIPIPQS